MILMNPEIPCPKELADGEACGRMMRQNTEGRFTCYTCGIVYQIQFETRVEKGSHRVDLMLTRYATFEPSEFDAVQPKPTAGTKIIAFGKHVQDYDRAKVFAQSDMPAEQKLEKLAAIRDDNQNSGHGDGSFNEAKWMALRDYCDALQRCIDARAAFLEEE